jgi:hypothetical protein
MFTHFIWYKEKWRKRKVKLDKGGLGKKNKNCPFSLAEN